MAVVLAHQAVAKLNTVISATISMADITEYHLELFHGFNEATANTNVQSREYDLEIDPVVVTDVTTLGFTPSVFIKARIK